MINPELAQRVDWRFLLSAPEPGSVAVLAGADGALEDALRAISSAVTIVRDFREVELDSPQYDLVVLVDPPAEQVIAAARTLLVGGWAYLEVSALRPRPLRRPRAVSAYTAILRRAGLDDVRGYWHLPDVVSCEEIVEIGRPEALEFAFNRRPRRRPVDRLKDTLALTLARPGLLGYVVPHGSAVGRRAGKTP